MRQTKGGARNRSKIGERTCYGKETQDTVSCSENCGRKAKMLENLQKCNTNTVLQERKGGNAVAEGGRKNWSRR